MTWRSRWIVICLGSFALFAAGLGYAFRPAQPAVDPTGDAIVASAEGDAARAAARANLPPAQRAAMDAIVRAYILDHPEVIRDAVRVLNEREDRARIAAVAAQADRPFPGAVLGNPDGTRTLVEFTDYNCTFCRASLPDVQRLIAAEPQVRVVMRELPILAPSSRTAALWALAAAEQGRYAAYHDAMFAGPRPDDATIRAAAVKAGLDLPRAERFVTSDAARRELATNLDLARAIGTSGTPTFIAGDQLLEGAVGYDRLKAAVDQGPAGRS